MNMGTWLDIAIALAVFYFLLATVSSVVLEFFSALSGIRGRALSKFVSEMVTGQRTALPKNDWLLRIPRRLIPKFVRELLRRHRGEQPKSDDPEGGKSVLKEANWLLQHPLILSLAKPKLSTAGTDNQPSYIPSKIFSQAMLSALVQRYGALSVLVPPGDREAVVVAIGQSPLTAWLLRAGSGGASLWPLLRELVGDADAGPEEWQVIRDRLNAWLGVTGDGPLKTLLGQAAEVAGDLVNEGAVRPAEVALEEWCRRLAARLPVPQMTYEVLQGIVSSGALSPSLTQTLQTVLDVANYDVEEVRRGVERWYDGVMDRASGWFKRRSMAWLFGIGLFLAVLMNLDSLMILQQLVEKPALRQQAVLLGETLARTTPEQAAVIPQQTAFAIWVREQNLDSEGRPEGKAGDVTKDQAKVALGLLLRSPLLAEPLLASSARGADDPEWAAAVRRLATASCRLRLHRVPRDLVSPALRTLTEKADDELLEHPFCAEEAKAIKLETPVCALLNLSGVTWHPGAARHSWDIVLGTSPSPCTKLEAKALQETTLDQYREAVAANAPVINTLGNAFRLLEGVGPINEEWHRVQWPRSVLGWVLTALLDTFGAPFWFDLLNKLVNRRATGPADSRD